MYLYLGGGAVIQTLIPEGSEPLVVLPGLSCGSFPLILITSVVILRDAKRSVYSTHILHYLHCGAAVQFPLGSQDRSLQSAQ